MADAPKAPPLDVARIMRDRVDALRRAGHVALADRFWTAWQEYERARLALNPASAAPDRHEQWERVKATLAAATEAFENVLAEADLFLVPVSMIPS